MGSFLSVSLDPNDRRSIISALSILMIRTHNHRNNPGSMSRLEQRYEVRKKSMPQGLLQSNLSTSPMTDNVGFLRVTACFLKATIQLMRSSEARMDSNPGIPKRPGMSLTRTGSSCLTSCLTWKLH
jgi:hypothetical protein